MLGQLPIERITPCPVFDKVGVDYAGPVLGHVRKPTVVKAYICFRITHCQGCSSGVDITTDAFIACLRQFISRRGIPSHIWSDHGTNFVGAAREVSLSIFTREQYSQINC